MTHPRIPLYPRRRLTFTPAAFWVVVGLFFVLGLCLGLLVGEVV